GKSTAISGRRATSPASASGSSSGFSQTPMSFLIESASCCADHRASGTMAGVDAGTSASAAVSGSSAQRSSIKVRSSVRRGIDALLERLEDDTPHGADEPLVVVAPFDVATQHLGEHDRHLAHAPRPTDPLDPL